MLDARGLRPRKRFGQNFLVDPHVAERIASAVPEKAFVVEIGAGTGALTAALAGRARTTIALEIDRDLVSLLRERFASDHRVDVRECDARTFDFEATLAAQSAPRTICGNLPYYITTPLIERILACINVWDCAILTVQREYARRLTARSTTPEYGSLTVFVAYYCTVEKLFEIGAAGFYPAPAVASTAIRLVPRPNRSAGVADEGLLLRTIRVAFAQRRKTLANCLVARAPAQPGRDAVEKAIRNAKLDPTVRGERLNLDDFRRLANALSDAGIDIV